MLSLVTKKQHQEYDFIINNSESNFDYLQSKHCLNELGGEFGSRSKYVIENDDMSLHRQNHKGICYRR